MDNTTYPGSETDVNETYDNCDFHSLASNELDFVDHWVNLTVEKEVLRGCKLREEKVKSYPLSDEYDVGNVNLIPPANNTPCYRKPSPGRTKMKTGSCSPRSNSPFFRGNSSSRAYTLTCSRPNTPSFKARCASRCPMRIAELAVPTKRQCIDTWRNKCDVLPAFMVERLRQQIMDERPIVHIPEAISCFKRRKPKSIKSVKRTKKGARDSKLKNERMAEIRNLCAAFANKIAQRLITSQNLKLTPELEKISKIVADEITNIIQNRRKFSLDDVTNKKIQADIADKIAIWISSILEDTSYKILEEDLRVKKQFEREVDVKEEQLVTLIGKLQNQEKTSELEEEEGPVLDFIDDLVDNVVTICEPQQFDVEEIDNLSETTSKGSGERYDSIPSQDSIGNTEADPSTLDEKLNINNDTGDSISNKSKELELQDPPASNNDNQPFDQSGDVEGIKLDINDHIRQELQKIVDHVIPADYDDNIEDIYFSNNKDINDETQDQLVDETDFTIQNAELHESLGNSELTTHLDEVLSVPDLALAGDKVLSSNNSFEDSLDEPNPNLENDNAEINNVSEAFELLAEESLDEKNKKVKFSDVDMDIRGTTRKLDSDSALQSLGHTGREKERVSWRSSSDSIKHAMVFAPPNENLLSDADELWPDDIATPVLKPSASVSRSVTSLGKILEKDDLILENEINELEDTHHAEEEILEPTNIVRSLIGEENKERNEQENKEAGIVKDKSNVDSTDDTNQDVTDETSSVNTIKAKQDNAMMDKTVEANALLEPETKRLSLDSSTSPIKITINDDTLEEKKLIAEKPLAKKDIKNLESDTNVIYEAVQQKMKSSYAIAEPKHDYKVHAKTAPSWLHDHGKGEPSEDSFRGDKSKEKIKESEIRNWCRDLERIFANLEMWNNWVDTTCKNIMYLKQKREMNKLFVPNSRKKDARDWMTLKKNIDKDTVLWTKLNQKAYQRLKTYQDKTKYQSPAQSEILNMNDDNIEAVLKTVQDIDRICLWMHRTIVSTEYCMLCDCKNTTKRKPF
ncbi:uncharacterized protein LOC135073225 isoform X1 [Ostrinia nubilalis]|uniref:uncharacterized protein LOC135073225 isoform X1 n=1 Tax=Ostrinia nubilalis TaxID=29057 RepID=UPI0030825CA1